MKLIESKAEYIPQEPTLEGIYKQIELAGRTAYKSEANITPDSAKTFVDRMIKSNHGACLEHGTIYLAMPMETVLPIEANEWAKYSWNPHSKGGIICEIKGEKRVACTTNLRVLVENNWLNDLEYLCEPTEYHEKRYTMKFTCDIGICRELLRHRSFSFLNESTRYCNYSKDKFGNELTFIIPSWFDYNDRLIKYLKTCERLYLDMIAGIETIGIVEMPGDKFTPEQARQVLPLATKCDLIMTGFASDWKRLLKLRLFEETGKVHPDMKVLMEKLKAECIKNEIWDDIINSDCKEV